MNKSQGRNLRLDALAAISGFMIAMQARVNGELSHRLDNAPQAALVSFSSGLFFIAIYALFSKRVHEGIRKLRIAVAKGEIPKWRLLAGALGGCFVAIQTSIVFFIGVALYSVASIAGQTAVSLIVDRIGLTGGGPKLISPRRVTAAGIKRHLVLGLKLLGLVEVIRLLWWKSPCPQGRFHISNNLQSSRL